MGHKEKQLIIWMQVDVDYVRNNGVLWTPIRLESYPSAKQAKQLKSATPSSTTMGAFTVTLVSTISCREPDSWVETPVQAFDVETRKEIATPRGRSAQGNPTPRLKNSCGNLGIYSGLEVKGGRKFNHSPWRVFHPPTESLIPI
jgi:hypothetical protein